ncbi:alpha-1B adrenergic receptor [Suricata suricatta]|nr:alpha-1B adrenergic receptor [Suricata suricatta]
MNPDLDTGHNTSAPAHWGELKNANFTGPNQTSSNSTLPQLDITRAISVGLVLGAFILFAIVGNIVVILSVACNRHLRTPTNYFIVNLAIADLLLSFTVLPFSAALEVLGYWVLGRVFCDIWAAVDVLCCTASILSLCAISIDRYIGVRYSLQYPTLVTRRKAILALLSVWVLSTVISIGPLLGWKEPAPNDDKECGVTEEPFYALFSSLGSFYIPLAVILVMYCRVYIVAKRTTKNLEAGVMKEMSNSKELTLRIHSKNFHEDTLSSTKAKGHNPRSSIAVKLFKFSREKKAAKTLGIVVGMFILCWLPFFIALPLGSLFSTLKPPDAVFKVVFWLGYFNSCLNPIIYPCSSKEFKRAFVRVLGCQCRGRRRRRRRRRPPTGAQCAPRCEGLSRGPSALAPRLLQLRAAKKTEPPRASPCGPEPGILPPYVQRLRNSSLDTAVTAPLSLPLSRCFEPGKFGVEAAPGATCCPPRLSDGVHENERRNSTCGGEIQVLNTDPAGATNFGPPALTAEGPVEWPLEQGTGCGSGSLKVGSPRMLWLNPPTPAMLPALSNADARRNPKWKPPPHFSPYNCVTHRDSDVLSPLHFPGCFANSDAIGWR